MKRLRKAGAWHGLWTGAFRHIHHDKVELVPRGSKFKQDYNVNKQRYSIQQGDQWAGQPHFQGPVTITLGRQEARVTATPQGHVAGVRHPTKLS
ncbi:hypothetical protein E2C01_013981 [Portunus trituberculatus]|uniref:Uncharacterized protein n=1 Tax=Portunus trituberculatus TaxID=210409 RepID=A0A5B7DHZ6_PORTR|nr:hypothetical protein [Portunus trituberculatus]